MRRGKSSNLKIGWDKGFPVPGTFKLDHLHFKPLLFWKFSIFFTFILGGQFLLPQRANIGKREFFQPQHLWDRGFSVPWALKLDHLHPFKPLLFWKFSIFFTFILGSLFLLPQRTNNWKREFTQLQKWMRQKVFSALGNQIGPFAACSAAFLLIFLQLFHFHTGESILITPKGQ